MTTACWIRDDGGRVPVPPELLPMAPSPIEGALRQVDGTPYRRGWIAVTRAAAASTLRLDAGAVSPGALAVAQELVGGGVGPVTLIRRCAGAWLGERLAPGTDLQAVLDGLHGERPADWSRSALVAAIDLASLDAAYAAPLLRAGLEAWDRGRGVLTDETFGAGRLLECSQVQLLQEDGSIRFFYVGSRSTTAAAFGQSWSSLAAGASSVPDVTFDREATEAYARVHQTGEPRADTVHCRVQLPDGKSVWGAYQRLVLPMRFRSGVPVINSLTAFVPFDLPLAA